MREILFRLCEHSDEFAQIFALVDRSALAGGRLIVTPRMLEALVKILSNRSLCVEHTEFAADGTIHLTASVGGMRIDYVFRIDRFSVVGGNAGGRIFYTETRRGGGLGNALLGISGKSSLAFALSGHRWLQITDSEIAIAARSLPQSLRISWQSVTRNGIVFRV